MAPEHGKERHILSGRRMPQIADDFVFTGATQPGFEHRQDGHGIAQTIGHQDGYAIFEGKNISGGVVLDGCSASEGAKAGVIMAQKMFHIVLNKVVKSNVATPDLENVVQRLETRLLRCIKASVSGFPPAERNKQIEDTAMFTIVGFIANRNEVITFRCGDGYIKVNDDLETLDQLKKGAPAYLGFRAMSPAPFRDDQIRLEIKGKYDIRSINQIVVATDGCDQLAEGAPIVSPHPIPSHPPLVKITGLEDLLNGQPTEQELHDKLAAANRTHIIYVEKDQPNGTKGFEPRRHPGVFGDDASVVAMIRRPKEAEQS